MQVLCTNNPHFIYLHFITLYKLTVEINVNTRVLLHCMIYDMDDLIQICKVSETFHSEMSILSISQYSLRKNTQHLILDSVLVLRHSICLAWWGHIEQPSSFQFIPHTDAALFIVITCIHLKMSKPDPLELELFWSTPYRATFLPECMCLLVLICPPQA